MPALCVSILPYTNDELLALLSRCADADVIELRLDALALEAASILNWDDIRQRAAKPLLVTYRLPSEGGFFTGSVSERAALYQSALNAGVEYFDVEAVAWPAIKPLLSVPMPSTFVLSHHIFEPQPDSADLFTGGLSTGRMKSELDTLFAAETGAVNVIYKFIFTASTIGESGINAALTARYGLDYAAKRGKRLITHAMGEAGEPSRILTALDRENSQGNVWTYCALDASSSTASGQITLHEARHLYRLHEKTSSTSVYALLGNPTRHSKGRFLHNALAARLSEQRLSEQDYIQCFSHKFLYLNLPTANADNFWLRWWETKLLSGFSVTIPHKEAMFQRCQIHNAVSPLAVRAAACNTVTTINKALYSTNTDVLALMDCLRPHTAALQHGMLLIGTGATTQSAITALQELGVTNIVITGRNVQRGEQLASQYSCDFIEQNLFTERHFVFGGIIQTTPVGMYPTPDATPLPADTLRMLFTPTPVVMDVIYNPPKTHFLSMAAVAGCITIAGGEMFLRQAAHQFTLFTGVTVEMPMLREIWHDLNEPSAPLFQAKQ